MMYNDGWEFLGALIDVTEFYVQLNLQSQGRTK